VKLTEGGRQDTSGQRLIVVFTEVELNKARGQTADLERMVITLRQVKMSEGGREDTWWDRMVVLTSAHRQPPESSREGARLKRLIEVHTQLQLQE
jgi:hypothetical protein